MTNYTRARIKIAFIIGFTVSIIIMAFLTSCPRINSVSFAGVGDQDIAVNTTWSCDQLISGILTVKSGYTLTLDSYAEEGGDKVITITANKIIVEQGAVITAVGKGFPGGNAQSDGEGPGGGKFTDEEEYCGGGGGFGGAGGDGPGNDGGAGGPAYEISAEVGHCGMGSGGGGAYNAKGGAGGGAIKLNAGEIIVNGEICVNGMDGETRTNDLDGAGGGGSGGSIVLGQDSKLMGEGTVSLKGGDGGTVYTSIYGGGGSGGRFISYGYINDFEGNILLTGGNQGYSEEEAIGGEGKKHFVWASNKTWDTAVTIKAGIEVLVNSAGTNQIVITAPNFILEEGASISANGTGRAGGALFAHGLGSGSGLAGSTKKGGGGGGFGGTGGAGEDNAGSGGTEYALIDSVLGSGGGGGSVTPGGSGGGAIKFDVPGTLTINGTVSANGEGHYYLYDVEEFTGGAGGGSGGSIVIETGTLDGTGTISANGGTGQVVYAEIAVYAYYGGGGAGGRIEINYGTGWAFNGNMSVNPGTFLSSGSGGEIGDIQAKTNSDITINSDAKWCCNHSIGDLGAGWKDLTVTDEAILTIQSNTLGKQTEINAGNITIDEGASISANGQGHPGGRRALWLSWLYYFINAEGEGKGESVQTYDVKGGGGAGFVCGGQNGGWYEQGGAGGNSYFSSYSSPIEMGSGGGGVQYVNYMGTLCVGSGGGGGGSVKLKANNDLIINGFLSANGENGASGCQYLKYYDWYTGTSTYDYAGGGGGGSGGTIVLNAKKANFGEKAIISVNGGFGGAGGTGIPSGGLASGGQIANCVTDAGGLTNEGAYICANGYQGGYFYEKVGSSGGGGSLPAYKPPPVHHYEIEEPAEAVAGEPFSIKITPKSIFDEATVGMGVTLTAETNETGALGTGTLTLGGAEPKNLIIYGATTITDLVYTKREDIKIMAVDSIGKTSIFDNIENTLSVKSGTIGSFAVNASATSIHQGCSVNIIVTARDIYNNLAVEYKGPMSITSNDPNAELPSSYYFNESDNGVYAFSAILNSVGTSSITVCDYVETASQGSSGNIVVSPLLNVTSPSYQDAVYVGGTLSVKWTAYERTGNPLEKVKIYYSTSESGYTEYYPIALADNTHVYPADNVYNWNIPFSVCGQIKIKVEAEDEPAINGVSKMFYIQLPYIGLIYPNNGTEIWCSGSEQTITWEESPQILSQKTLTLYADVNPNDGVINYAEVIKTGEMFPGNEYTWEGVYLVPEGLRDKVKVRIEVDNFYQRRANTTDEQFLTEGMVFEDMRVSGEWTDAKLTLQPNEIIAVTAYSRPANNEEQAKSYAVDHKGNVWKWGEGNVFEEKIAGLNNITTLVVGYYHALALDAEGKVWAWGSNYYGQLGTGEASDVPIQVGGGLADKKVKKIACGDEHSLAIDEDGNVWGWGRNDKHAVSPDWTTNESYPVQMTYTGDFKDIGGGNNFSILVRSNGEVWACGDNMYGYIGDGTENNARYLKKIEQDIDGNEFQGLASVSVGSYHVLGADDGGNVWAWGRGHDYRLGHGDTSHQYKPKKVTALDPETITEVVAGYKSSFALNESGDIWAWGDNEHGRLGLGDTSDEKYPAQIPGITGIKLFSTYGSHSIAIRNNADILTWGDNRLAQLGKEEWQPCIHEPEIIEDNNTNSFVNNNFQKVSVSIYHVLALDAEGKVWAWGSNNYGQIGDGTQITRSAPVKVQGLAGVVITDISAGQYHSLALDSNGFIWAWGRSNYGQIGNGTSGSNVLQPVKIETDIDGNILPLIQKIAAGGEHSLALSNEILPKIYTWGRNSSGQLGIGNTTQQTRPIKLTHIEVGGTSFKILDIAAGDDHSLALRNDGGIRSWGEGSYGRLGRGSTTTDQKLPVAVYNIGSAKAISAGYQHNIAKVEVTAGVCRLYTWGRNNYGQIGDSKTSSYYGLPQIVDWLGDINVFSGDANIIDVNAGGDSCSVTYADGDNVQVYICGRNDYGQLGDNTGTKHSKFEKAANLQAYKVKQFVMGYYHSTLITGDDKGVKIATTGSNEYKGLGNGWEVYCYSPLESSAKGEVITKGTFISGVLFFDNYEYGPLEWEISGSAPEGITHTYKFQVAASEYGDDWGDGFIGPDGTSDTYFTESGETMSLDALNGKAGFKYRLELETTDPLSSPEVNSVTINYAHVDPDYRSISDVSDQYFTVQPGGSVTAITIEPLSVSADQDVEIDVTFAEARESAYISVIFDKEVFPEAVDLIKQEMTGSGTSWSFTVLGELLPTNEAQGTATIEILYADCPIGINRTFTVDNQAPEAPSNVTFTATGGTEKPGYINNTNTGFEVTFIAPDVFAGDKAHLYIDNADVAFSDQVLSAGSNTWTYTGDMTAMFSPHEGLDKELKIAIVNQGGTKGEESEPINIIIDTTAPTVLPANISVNNQNQPNKIIITASEDLDAGTVGSGTWIVTDNSGAEFDIAAAELSGVDEVTLTLANVDPAETDTYITNEQAGAGIKVTVSNVQDTAGNVFDSATITASGGTNYLHESIPEIASGNIKVNNTADPHVVTLVANEPLNKDSIEEESNWSEKILKSNDGSVLYKIDSVSLGSDYRTITLTLPTIDPVDSKTYITNAQITAKIKLDFAGNVNLKDIYGIKFDSSVNETALATGHIADTAKPTVSAAEVYINNSENPHEITVTLNEKMDKTSSENASNWKFHRIEGVTTFIYNVTEAALDPGGKIVVLKLSPVDPTVVPVSGGDPTYITNNQIDTNAFKIAHGTVNIKDIAGNSFLNSATSVSTLVGEHTKVSEPPVVLEDDSYVDNISQPNTISIKFNGFLDKTMAESIANWIVFPADESVAKYTIANDISVVFDIQNGSTIVNLTLEALDLDDFCTYITAQQIASGIKVNFNDTGLKDLYGVFFDDPVINDSLETLEYALTGTHVSDDQGPEIEAVIINNQVQPNEINVYVTEPLDKAEAEDSSNWSFCNANAVEFSLNPAVGKTTLSADGKSVTLTLNAINLDISSTYITNDQTEDPAKSLYLEIPAGSGLKDLAGNAVQIAPGNKYLVSNYAGYSHAGGTGHILDKTALASVAFDNIEALGGTIQKIGYINAENTGLKINFSAPDEPEYFGIVQVYISDDTVENGEPLNPLIKKIVLSGDTPYEITNETYLTQNPASLGTQGQKKFFIKVIDPAGNVSEASGIKPVTYDTTSPSSVTNTVIIGKAGNDVPGIINSTNTTFNISFTPPQTECAGNAYLYVNGTKYAYRNVSISASDGSNGITKTITGIDSEDALGFDGNKTIAVKIIDAAGNEGTAENIIIITKDFLCPGLVLQASGQPQYTKYDYFTGKLTCVFTKNMDTNLNDLVKSGFTLSHNGAGTVALGSEDNAVVNANKITFTLSATHQNDLVNWGLIANNILNLNISEQACRDANGNYIDIAWTGTNEIAWEKDNQPPVLTAGGETYTHDTKTLVLEFSEVIDPDNINKQGIKLAKNASGGEAFDLSDPVFSLDIGGAILTFILSDDARNSIASWQQGANVLSLYMAQGAVRDMPGNGIEEVSWQAITNWHGDGDAPVLDPAGLFNYEYDNKKLTCIFSEDIDPDSIIDHSKFKLAHTSSGGEVFALSDADTVNVTGRNVVFTLTDANKDTIAPWNTELYLFLEAGAVKDFAGIPNGVQNWVQAENVAGDTTPPKLDEDDGSILCEYEHDSSTLTCIFTETLDVSETDPTKFYLANQLTGGEYLQLSLGELSTDLEDNRSDLTFVLTEEHRDEISGWDASEETAKLYIEIYAGAVQDLSENPIVAMGASEEISWVKDETKPVLSAIEYAYATKELTCTFEEKISMAAVTANKFHLSCPEASGLMTLQDSNKQNPQPDDSNILVFTLSDSQNETICGWDFTAKGAGQTAELNINIDAEALTDLSGNNINAVTDMNVDWCKDESIPNLIQSSYNHTTGELICAVDEKIKEQSIVIDSFKLSNGSGGGLFLCENDGNTVSLSIDGKTLTFVLLEGQIELIAGWDFDGIKTLHLLMLAGAVKDLSGNEISFVADHEITGANWVKDSIDPAIVSAKYTHPQNPGDEPELACIFTEKMKLDSINKAAFSLKSGTNMLSLTSSNGIKQTINSDTLTFILSQGQRDVIAVWSAVDPSAVMSLTIDVEGIKDLSGRDNSSSIEQSVTWTKDTTSAEISTLTYLHEQMKLICSFNENINIDFTKNNKDKYSLINDQGEEINLGTNSITETDNGNTVTFEMTTSQSDAIAAWDADVDVTEMSLRILSQGVKDLSGITNTSALVKTAVWEEDTTAPVLQSAQYVDPDRQLICVFDEKINISTVIINYFSLSNGETSFSLSPSYDSKASGITDDILIFTLGDDHYSDIAGWAANGATTLYLSINTDALTDLSGNGISAQEEAHNNFPITGDDWVKDTNPPTVSSANVIVRNIIDDHNDPCHKIKITSSEPLNKDTVTVTDNWLIKNNSNLEYDIKTAELSLDGYTVTLTLNTIDPSVPNTYITNGQIDGGIYLVFEDSNITDLSGQNFADASIKAMGAHEKDTTRPNVDNLSIIVNNSVQPNTITIPILEPLTENTAENPGNWKIRPESGADYYDIAGAELLESGYKVQLTLEAVNPFNELTYITKDQITNHIELVFEVGTNLKDIAGNPFANSLSGNRTIEALGNSHVKDEEPPVFAPNHISIDNTARPGNTITLTASEKLRAFYANTAGNWVIVNKNKTEGLNQYAINDAELMSDGGTVILTLADIDPTDDLTYITNSQIENNYIAVRFLSSQIQDVAGNNVVDVSGDILAKGTHIKDNSSPTIAPADIWINNADKPNEITINASEYLDSTSATNKNNWIITNNTGGIAYVIAEAQLLDVDTVVLTLEEVNPWNEKTYITNDQITAGIKIDVTSGAIKDLFGKAFDYTAPITALGENANHNMDDDPPDIETISINNTQSPHYVIITASEPLDEDSSETKEKWTLMAPGTSTIEYTIAASVLSFPQQVMLTLEAVDLDDDSTYITNDQMEDGIKVVFSLGTNNVKDLAGKPFINQTVIDGEIENDTPDNIPPSAPPSISAFAKGGNVVTGHVNSSNDEFQVDFTSPATNFYGIAHLYVNEAEFSTPKTVAVTQGSSGYSFHGTPADLGADGDKNLKVVIIDVAGNAGSPSQTVILHKDADAPDQPANVSISALGGTVVREGYINAGNTHFKVDFISPSENWEGTAHLYLDGVDFTPALTQEITAAGISYYITGTKSLLGVNDDVKNLSLVIVDESGNKSPAVNCPITKDTILPDPVTDLNFIDIGTGNPPANFINKGSTGFKVQFTSPSSEYTGLAQLYVNGALFTTDVNLSVDAGGIDYTLMPLNMSEALADLGGSGECVLDVKITDAAGNKGNATQSLTITIDKSEPSLVPKIVPPSGQEKVKNGNTIKIEGTAEAGSTIHEARVLDENNNLIMLLEDGTNCALDLIDGVFSGNFNLPTVIATSIKIQIVVKDIAGNFSIAQNSRSNSIQVDNSPPSLTTVMQSDNDNNTAYAKVNDEITLNIIAVEDIKDVEVVIGKGIMGEGTLDEGYVEVTGSGMNWTAKYKMTEQDDNGPVLFSINYKDIVGNSGLTTTNVTTGNKVIFDKSVPKLKTVSLVSANGRQYIKPGQGVVLSIEADENLQRPIVKIMGNSSDVTGSGQMWSTVYIMKDTDLEGDITFTIDFYDIPGNQGIRVDEVTIGNPVEFDKTPPELSSVTIKSNNSNQTYAAIGDTITLTITAQDTIQSPTVTIMDKEDVIIIGEDKNWTASYTILNDVSNGNVVFTIDYKDLAGNDGVTGSEITEGSNVEFDKETPKLTAVTIKSNNA
ncbi:MAG: hypothetical protein ABH869_01785, partial [Candidatus Omnitrophota bacterium]